MLDIQIKEGGDNVILGDLIKKYRADNGMSMEQFAQRSGLSKAYVSILERNRNPVNGKPVVPSLETIKAVAQATGQDFNDIIAMLDVNQPVQVSPSIPAGFAPLPKKRRVPRVGQIACGEPILAEENIDGYDEIPDDWGADFTLLCRGDSMEPKIKDGDVVAIRTQPQVENGEIAAVRIGEEATLKRVYCNGNTIILQAENPTFPPLVYSRQEAEDIHVEGKAVGLCRKL